jgi:DNA-binding Lrp family transcriptional regulator
MRVKALNVLRKVHPRGLTSSVLARRIRVPITSLTPVLTKLRKDRVIFRTGMVLERAHEYKLNVHADPGE